MSASRPPGRRELRRRSEVPLTQAESGIHVVRQGGAGMAGGHEHPVGPLGEQAVAEVVVG